MLSFASAGAGALSWRMAILKIARMGHPVLAAPAAPVEDPSDPALRRLVADMIETMDDAPGTGLAAPQVHVPLRVVTFTVSAGRAEREDGGAAVPLTVMINPVIEVLDERRDQGWEGCLSVPGLSGEVPRFRRIGYAFTDLKGRRQEREAEGFHARVVQHECDHLDGILYPQRMPDLGRLVFNSELHHLVRSDRGAETVESEE